MIDFTVERVTHEVVRYIVPNRTPFVELSKLAAVIDKEIVQVGDDELWVEVVNDIDIALCYSRETKTVTE